MTTTTAATATSPSAASPSHPDQAYVHGYSPAEARRLGDQADTLAGLLHAGTAYPPGSRVLEAGCGVGAQTVHLLEASPGLLLTATDISADSLALARARVAEQLPEAQASWHHGDLHRLPFPTVRSTTSSSASYWNTSPTRRRR